MDDWMPGDGVAALHAASGLEWLLRFDYDHGEGIVPTKTTTGYAVGIGPGDVAGPTLLHAIAAAIKEVAR
jgi:hypothetical protein